MSSRRIVGFAILLSLLLHFGFGVGLSLVPVPESQKKPVEIQIVESKEANKILEELKRSQQVVRDVTAPDNLRDDSQDTLAKLLSAKRQRVLNEVRAKENGMTKNRDGFVKKEWTNKTSKGANSKAANYKKSAEQAQSDLEKKQQLEKDKDGYQVFNVPKEFKRFAQGQDAGPSTIGEDLPKETAVGSFTALNTDRYIYYSFYARIEELVRFRWETKVQQALDHFDRGILIGTIGKKKWITHIEFWLYSDGRFHSAHILKESGINKFDQAAVFAFRDAQQFPNPPKDLIEKDGFIRVIYSFNVDYSPNVLVDR